MICRSYDECLNIYNDSNLGGSALIDEEIILLVQKKQIPAYQIEKAVDDPVRGVRIRRKMLTTDAKLNEILNDLPYKNYDYNKVSQVLYSFNYLSVFLSITKFRLHPLVFYRGIILRASNAPASEK